jgi:hypothetical protein
LSLLDIWAPGDIEERKVGIVLLDGMKTILIRREVLPT